MTQVVQIIEMVAPVITACLYSTPPPCLGMFAFCSHLMKSLQFAGQNQVSSLKKALRIHFWCFFSTYMSQRKKKLPDEVSPNPPSRRKSIGSITERYYLYSPPFSSHCGNSSLFGADRLIRCGVPPRARTRYPLGCQVNTVLSVDGRDGHQDHLSSRSRK